MDGQGRLIKRAEYLVLRFKVLGLHFVIYPSLAHCLSTPAHLAYAGTATYCSAVAPRANGRRGVPINVCSLQLERQ